MPSRNRKKRCKQRAEYLQKREDILSQENKAKARERYKADPEKKKASVRDTYNANAVSKRAAKRQRYQEDVEENRAAKRQRYHSAKSLLCDTVYYSVYSKISSNISCLRIEHYMQMRILKYCQSRAVSGILANL